MVTLLSSQQSGQQGDSIRPLSGTGAVTLINCWAKSLGDCDARSGEHVISKAVFAAGCDCPRTVQGVRRIRGGQPTPNAEKSNILCRHHNSQLSPLDAVAGDIAAFQAKANDESFEGELYVVGELLERWLLKTVVNSAAAGWAGPRKWLPSDEIVAAIYGFTAVPKGAGLYSVDGMDPRHRDSGGVSFTPIIEAKPDDPQLIGAYLAVHGMPLFAAFGAQIIERLESGEIPCLSQHFSPEGLQHLYHPSAIVMGRKKGETRHFGTELGRPAAVCRWNNCALPARRTLDSNAV